MLRLFNIKKSLAAFIITGLVFVMIPVGLALAQTTAVPTDPNVSSQVDGLNAQAAAVKQEISNLNLELELVVEQHNATRVELDRLTLELADSRARLDDLLAEQNAQEKILNDRLRAVYKAGDINFLSILLNSRSLNDFYEQTRYIQKINEQDAKLEQQYEERADEIAALTENIDAQRFQSLDLERSLEKQQELIEVRIAEQQNRLNQLDEQVKQILTQEAERQRAEQARIAAEQQALLNELQITNEVQAQVVQTALQYLGVPYVWGGESPSGFDCSGLTKYVFAQHGVSLPHYAASQYNLGAPVSDGQLQPGDLVFWGPGHPHHVGMYIGAGKYIEAPNFGEVVKISELEFDGDYAGARRYPLRPRS